MHAMRKTCVDMASYLGFRCKEKSYNCVQGTKGKELFTLGELNALGRQLVLGSRGAQLSLS